MRTRATDRRRLRSLARAAAPCCPPSRRNGSRCALRTSVHERARRPRGVESGPHRGGQDGIEGRHDPRTFCGHDRARRAAREELDALRVMGLDPVRRLVVPRFLALVFISPMLCTLILVSGTTAAFILAVTVADVTPGSFWMSFGTFAKVTDIWFAIGKT